MSQPQRRLVLVCSLTKETDDGDLYRSVQAVLQATALPPELLEIEVTESEEIESPTEFIHQIDLLNKLGVSVSLDDFGSGFCSLSHVERFQVSKLKIDKSLEIGRAHV